LSALNQLRHCRGDLIWAVLLDEMPFGNGDSVWFGQLRTKSRTRPCTSAGVAVDEQLRHIAFRKPLTVFVTTATTSAGSPSIGMLRGHDSVGRRSSLGLQEGSR
jgi:hypothetical protein